MGKIGSETLKIPLKKFSLFILPVLFFLILIPAKSCLAGESPGKFVDTLIKKGLNPLLITGLLALLPVFELRGSIPVGIALLKQNIFAVYFISVFFNLIPVLPILLLLSPVRRLLSRYTVFKGFFQFLDTRAKKNRSLIDRYGELGLAYFVAIPLPVTGAWTGSLIAVFFGFPVFKSFIFISLGVMAAGVIVTLITVLGMVAFIGVVPVLALFAVLLILRFIKEKRRVA